MPPALILNNRIAGSGGLLEAFRAYARTAETTSSQLKSNHEIDEDEMREQLKALGYID